MRNSFSFALRSLLESKTRTFLSALGVMIAVVAILLLVAIAKGVQGEVTDEVRGLGINVVVVLPGRVDPENLMFNPNLTGLSFLSEQDAVSLKAVEGVVTAVPLTFAGAGIRRGDKDAFPITIATTADWFKIRPPQMQEGRTFTSSEASSKVCVIGSIAKEALFGSEQATGKTIEYNRTSFTIVGVTQERQSQQGLLSMGGFENVVYFPYHTLKVSVPDLHTHRIMIRSQESAEPKELVKKIEAVMAKRLDRQQFSVLTQEDLLGLVYRITGILTWLVAGLTSIALFVGAVGIMAIMLLSTNERAKEIGVRKAIGARNKDIFHQFLIESVLVGLLGGTMGLGLSIAVVEILDRFTKIHPLLTPGLVGSGFAVCLGLGAVFGVLPALQAARKDPVVALRSE